MRTRGSSDLRRRRDVGELVNFTFDFLRENLRPLGKSILYICGPVIAVTAIVVGAIHYSNELEVAPGASSFVYGLFYLGWKSVVASLLLYILSGVFLSTVVSAYVILREEREADQISVEDVWEMTRTNFVRAFVATIVVLFFVAVGSAVFLIPGIYLGVLFSIIVTVQMAEDLDLGEAISRCTKLMRDNWWSTAGMLFVIGIITIFLSYGPMFSYYIVMLIAESVGIPESGFTVLNVVIQVVSMVFQLLLTVVSILATALNYFNLVEGRDGVGLLAKIEQIGAFVDEDLPARQVP